MGHNRNADFFQFPHRAVVWGIADLLCAGGGRVHRNGGLQVIFFNQVGHDALGHGAAADVAVADE